MSFFSLGADVCERMPLGVRQVSAVTSILPAAVALLYSCGITNKSHMPWLCQ